MVTRGVIAVAIVVVLASGARADVAVEDRVPRSSTWIEADVHAGIVVPADTRWSIFGLGLELRQRVIGGLRVAVRGAVLRAAPGFDPDRIGMVDDRRGTGLHAGISIDYLITIKQWRDVGRSGRRLALTVAPELGVGVTELRGVGPDDARFRTLFIGPRFGIEMTNEHRVNARSTALLAAHSWGGHLAIQLIDAGGDDRGWQFVVGYSWGR